MPKDPSNDKYPDVISSDQKRPYSELWWQEVVQPLKIREYEESARLHRLIDSRQMMSGVLTACTTKESTEKDLWTWFTTFAEGHITFFSKRNKRVNLAKYVHKKKKLVLIAIGLSFMQFLSIAEILGVQLGNFQMIDLPLALVSGVAALSLTFGAKEALIRWVKVEHATCSSQSFVVSLLRGNTLAWASLAVVLMEAAFTAPGLIALLPPALALQLMPQVTAYVASGLAGYINVFLSWSLALEELNFEKRFVEPIKVERADRSLSTLIIDHATARMIRANYDKEVKEQRRTVKHLRRMYRKALNEWLREVRYLKESN
jgi:hypothetical protein